jgi:preprotein translocase subunit SecB
MPMAFESYSSSNSSACDKSVEAGVPLEPIFEHECVTTPSEKGFIEVVCSYKFKVRAAGADVADAQITYNVLYKLIGDEPPVEADITQFASANGAYHSWPFVRETIYGLTSRMGFPPYTLPVLSFVPKKAEATPSKAATTETPAAKQ